LIPLAFDWSDLHGTDTVSWLRYPERLPEP
jgi:hypothetical protein